MTDALISEYHAHVYFDIEQLHDARQVCESAREQLEVPMGNMHSGPVGPHPRGSCQLLLPPESLAQAVPWLMANRGEFTVFLHGVTGDDIYDHTQLVSWLGESETLNLAALAR